MSAVAAFPVGAVKGGIALRSFLGPLASLLASEEVNEVSINRPGEAFVDRGGVIERIALPALDYPHLMRLASLIAYETQQVIDETQPLLSAWLPDGQRVQVVLPPACEAGTVVMSFRRPSQRLLSLEECEAQGMFERFEVAKQEATTDIDRQLAELLEAGRVREFLRTAVKAGRNIVVSGSTNSGKTTFINTLLREIPQDERLVTIEDVRELRPLNPNSVHLLGSKGGQGVAKVTIQELLEASLRLRPDRIILGELRGAEAASFLHAINSGHPGSLTSVHADSPALAFERLALMVMQGQPSLSRDHVLDYLRNIVDVVVQIVRTQDRRAISQIYFKHAVALDRNALACGP